MGAELGERAAAGCGSGGDGFAAHALDPRASVRERKMNKGGRREEGGMIEKRERGGAGRGGGERKKIRRELLTIKK